MIWKKSTEKKMQLYSGARGNTLVSPATNFLVLTHCLHYCVASFNSRERDLGSTCYHSEQLPNSIFTCTVNRGCCMSLRFCFLVFCLFYFTFFVFYIYLLFRDSNMISIGAVEFRCYIVVIILVNLEKL